MIIARFTIQLSPQLKDLREKFIWHIRDIWLSSSGTQKTTLGYYKRLAKTKHAIRNALFKFFPRPIFPTKHHADFNLKAIHLTKKAKEFFVSMKKECKLSSRKASERNQLLHFLKKLVVKVFLEDHPKNSKRLPMNDKTKNCPLLSNHLLFSEIS